MYERIAAVYDIHGNLPALDAVLAEIEAAGIERIVIGGDVVFGPFIRESLDRLRALGDRAIWIRGNCERELLEIYDGLSSSLPEEIQNAGKWEAQFLDQAYRDFLAALPEQQTLSIRGLGSVLFCHASPRNDSDLITATTPLERLRVFLAGTSANVVVCGHTHVQFERSCDAIRVVNAGSVGMAYGDPGAYWLLLGSEIELHRTSYDYPRTAASIRASGHPMAESFAENVETPTSAEEATAYFEQQAIA